MTSVTVTGPPAMRVADTAAGVVDTTSRSRTWSRGLSPFVLGPVELWGGHTARNVENAWQYSKVYPEHRTHEAWLTWARRGWNNTRAVRYPMGHGALPMYSYWDGERLDYVAARKRIYVPLYGRTVRKSAAYAKLWELYQAATTRLVLWSFDSYDHRRLGYSWHDVLNDPTRKMGHGFVLAMMLEGGYAPVREDRI